MKANHQIKGYLTINDWEIPILAEFEYHPGCKATWEEPAEEASVEIHSPERLDGLPWHDRCEEAFEEWAGGEGRDLAFEQMTHDWEDAEYAQDDL